jgi:glycosyltransferase involved in cell wall biosynthesis
VPEDGGPPRTEPVLVHDYLLVMRGAERTFAALCDIWPRAPLRTLVYSGDLVADAFPNRDIRASPAQRLGLRQRGFRALLPAYPALAANLPVGGHDLVISSSSAFAHMVRPDPGAIHICYCHSPFRYAWHERPSTLAAVSPVVRPALAATLDAIRRQDRSAAARVHVYIANSKMTSARIGEFYGRDAEVVHPPVDVDRFVVSSSGADDYFLCVGELVWHKRFETAIAAARRAGVRLILVGTGPDEMRLRALAAGTDSIEFAGRVDDETLSNLYAGARALIVPGIEEFGIAAVEAQAAGRPVVGRQQGGVAETVIDGRSGILVENGSVETLSEALAWGEFDSFDPDVARRSAERFAPERFRERITAIVDRACR